MEAAKKQIVESIEEEPSWVEFILKTILVLSLFRIMSTKPHGIHQYSYVANRSSTLTDSQTDQEVEVIALAKKEALLTGLAEVGKLVEEKEGLEAEIKDVKLVDESFATDDCDLF